MAEVDEVIEEQEEIVPAVETEELPEVTDEITEEVPEEATMEVTEEVTEEVPEEVTEVTPIASEDIQDVEELEEIEEDIVPIEPWVFETIDKFKAKGYPNKMIYQALERSPGWSTYTQEEKEELRMRVFPDLVVPGGNLKEVGATAGGDPLNKLFINDRENPNAVSRFFNTTISRAALARIIDKGPENLTPEEIKNISYYQRILRRNAPDPDDKPTTAIGKAVDFTVDLLKVIPESAISMLLTAPVAGKEMIIGGTAGTAIPIPGVGTVAGVTAGFTSATSYALEYSSALLEALENKGIDTSNAVALENAFNDKEIMNYARGYAKSKGVPVAIFDGLSGGLGGSIARTVANRGVKKALQQATLSKGRRLTIRERRIITKRFKKTGQGVVAQEGADTIFGGTGYVAGQQNVGEDIDPKSLVFEMAAGPVAGGFGAGVQAIKGQPLTRDQSVYNNIQNRIKEETNITETEAKKMSDNLFDTSQDVTSLIEDDKRILDIKEKINQHTLDLETKGLNKRQRRVIEKARSDAEDSLDSLRDRVQDAFVGMSNKDQVNLRDSFEDLKTLRTLESNPTNEALIKEKRQEVLRLLKKGIEGLQSDVVDRGAVDVVGEVSLGATEPLRSSRREKINLGTDVESRDIINNGKKIGYRLHKVVGENGDVKFIIGDRNGNIEDINITGTSSVEALDNLTDFLEGRRVDKKQEPGTVDTDTVEEVVVEDKNKIYHTTTLIKPLDEGVLKKSTSKSDEITMDDGKKSTASDEVYFTESPDWDGKFSGNYRLVFDRNKVSEKLEKGTRYKDEKELVSKEDVPLSKDNGLISIEFLVTSSFDYVSVSGMLQDDPRWIDADGSDAIELELAKELLTDQYKNTIETRKTEAQQQANKYGVPVILKADPVTEIADVTISPEETVVEEKAPPVIEDTAGSLTNDLLEQNFWLFKPSRNKMTAWIKEQSNDFVRLFQDRYEGLIRGEEGARKARGGTLDDSQSISGELSTIDGRVNNEVEKYYEGSVFDVLDTLYKSNNLKKRRFGKIRDKIDGGESKQAKLIKGFDNVLYALHAQERNAFLFKDKGVQGLSGMTDEKAREILLEAGVPEGKLDNPSVNDLDSRYRGAAKQYQIMNSKLRDLLVDTGLMSEKTKLELEKRYKNYAPLSGFDEFNEAISSPGTSTGSQGLQAKPFRTAEGRESAATDLLTQSISNNVNAIIAGRKNQSLEALYNLVEKNPNPQLWESSSPDINTPEGIEITNDLIRKSQRPESAVVNIKVNGKNKFVTFADARIAKNVKEGGSSMNGILKAMTKFNRIMSSFVTTYSGDFVLRNFVRDAQSAVFSLFQEQEDGRLKGKEIVGKVIGNTLPSVAQIFKIESGISKGSVSPEVVQLYKDYKADGGTNEWMYQQSFEAVKKDIEAMRDATSSTALGESRGLKAATDFIKKINTSVENGVRFAAYKKAREAGVNRKLSAQTAKELTINFNRRGEASQTANALYLFFNASVQGSARVLKSLRPKYKEVEGKKVLVSSKAQKLAGIYTGLGAMMSYFAEGQSLEDDDGESYYSKIPQYVRNTHMIIMKPNGKDYIKIPMPYGFNSFYVLGNSLANAQQGVSKKEDVFGNVIESVADSFSPIGTPGDTEGVAEYLVKYLVPLIGKAPLELALNKSFTGGEIYKEEYKGVKGSTPESNLGKGKYELMEAMTKYLNEKTGGSEYRSGGIDVNPDAASHLIRTLSGEVVPQFDRVYDVVTGIINEEDIPHNRIPLLRVFSAESPGYPNYDKYNERKDFLYQLEKEVKSKTDSDFVKGKEDKISTAYNKTEGIDAEVKAMREDFYNSYDEIKDAQSELKKAKEEKNKRKIKILKKNIEDLTVISEDLNTRIKIKLKQFNKMYEEYKIDKFKKN